MQYLRHKQHKFIKVITAFLSLVTLTACTTTNTISVEAKAKTSNVTKRHKKVKDKVKIVTAKSKKNFRKGYTYHYNHKKKIYYGHPRLTKSKKHKTRLKPSEPFHDMVFPENEVHYYPEYDHPSRFQEMETFSDDFLTQNHLNGTRWASKRITYNDDALSGAERTIAEEAIKQINDLHIVTLIKTSQSANITMTRKKPENSYILATTNYNWGPQRYKNLKFLDTAEITYYESNINEFYYNRILWNQTTLHEIGHALGLDHSDPNTKEVMVPFISPERILTNDGRHTIIDQGYINNLALLYNN